MRSRLFENDENERPSANLRGKRRSLSFIGQSPSNVSKREETNVFHALVDKVSTLALAEPEPCRRRPPGRPVGYYKRYDASRCGAHFMHTLFYKHSIATSRCRKTEWLLCGAHASSVLAARFPLVLDAVAGSSRLPNVYSTDTSGGRTIITLFPHALYAVAKYKYVLKAR